MRSLARWGVMIAAVSAFPIVQDVREEAFWKAGNDRFHERQLLALPLSFAGRSITIDDPLPRGGPRSEASEPSAARVLLDGREVLPMAPAMVRPGRDDLGRYHLWIDAWIFTDRRTGESSLYLGRRQRASAASGRSYDLLRLHTNGTYELRQLSFADRARSYPIWRTIQFLNDGAESVYPFSLTNVWPGLLVPVLYPRATFLLGVVMVAIGLWRRRSAGAAPVAAGS